MRKIKSTLVILLIVFFVTGIPKDAKASGGININEANYEELQKIKGIGKVIAQRIIEERPYDSLDDLIRVKGIGKVTLEEIKNQGLAYKKVSFDGVFPAKIIDIFESSSIAYSVGEGLNKSINDFVTEKELEEVKSVEANPEKYPVVYSLSGVQYLKNLYFLDVSDNKLRNLNGLEKIEYLQLYANNNQINDISGLKNLKFSDDLHLFNNQIDSIEYLSNLEAVNHFILDQNNISDLSPIGKMRFIGGLCLSGNPISSFASLKTVEYFVFVSFNGQSYYNYSDLEVAFPNMTNM
ncbi:helix-hairpin-helix domain-containing protein [Enterococcus quebecensis]|uniref:Helix-hairpin-helix DNA-binding motif class 1 domain-containing protein n=1 Tax=Enterococcus quebecensis TaxID=903983 RepID=A0A1E5H3V5_9ENTE|nr:helix-hairpin-helix domain-containing protein [Enterococcus quebecensis]OEG19340.1 hypothetical protein BCR23_01225 [Enterococcus quebecensis]